MKKLAPIALSYALLLACLWGWRISSQKPQGSPQPARQQIQTSPAPNAATALPAAQYGASASPVPSLGRGLPVSGWRGTL